MHILQPPHEWFKVPFYILHTMKYTALGGMFEVLDDHHKRVRFMNVQHCGGQSMVLLQLKDPLIGPIIEERGISSRL